MSPLFGQEITTSPEPPLLVPAPAGIDEAPAASLPSEAVPHLDEEEAFPLPKTDPTQIPKTANEPQVEINGRPQSPLRPKVALYVAARATYDDNIFIQPTETEADLYFSISPGIALGWGDVRREFRKLAVEAFTALDEEEDKARSYVFASYAPTATVFLDHSSEDVLDHDARFKAHWALAYLTLGVRSSFQTTSAPDIDLGTRVGRSTFTTELTANYDYSDRTSLESTVTLQRRAYEVGLDATEYTTENWFNYEYGVRTTFAAGVKLGYLQVESSSDQSYEQLLVRGEYKITEKIRVLADAGVEFRQIGDGGNPVNPVFGLELDYRPFRNTRVSLSGSRATENSAGLVDENIVSTSLKAGIRQRFLRRYSLGFEASYLNNSYHQAGGLAFESDRLDNYFSLKPSFRMEVTKSAGLEVNYQYVQQRSNFSEFTFVNNQVSIQINVLF